MWFTRHSVLPVTWRSKGNYFDEFSTEDWIRLYYAVCGFTNQIPRSRAECRVTANTQLHIKGEIAVIIMGQATTLQEPFEKQLTRPLMLHSEFGVTLRADKDIRVVCHWLYPGDWIDQTISRPYNIPTPGKEQVATPRRIAELVCGLAMVYSKCRVVDLFCGMGALSEPFFEKGHGVLLVDDDPTLRKPLDKWIKANKWKGAVLIQDFTATRVSSGALVIASPPLTKDGTLDSGLLSRFCNFLLALDKSNVCILIPHNLTPKFYSCIFQHKKYLLNSRTLVSLILPRSKEEHTATFKYVGMDIVSLRWNDQTT
ncbi:MAG: ORF4 protein [Fuyun tick rhabdovirus]|uniref:RNA-directed RNA polymerase L n=1 Tax=Fuyun tick rhabdovirus TaxID=2977134 RepID=A0A977R7T0_9RHAB|nr:MAG: ORF4 protein [Fuyun tick rhabdovirus]